MEDQATELRAVQQVLEAQEGVVVVVKSQDMAQQVVVLVALIMVMVVLVLHLLEVEQVERIQAVDQEAVVLMFLPKDVLVVLVVS